MRWVLRSKIHKAVVTSTNLEYIGSLTVDEALMEKAGLWAGEKVLVVSNTSGIRLETYLIAGEHGSGTVQINGAAARLVHPGEELIIMGFELTDQPIEARVVLVDERNRFLRYL